MKKRLILFTTLFAISLVACGNKNTAETDSVEIEETVVEEAATEDTTEDAPEVKNIPTEYTIDSIKEASKDFPESIDISGCDTFTQIVDKKLTEGMGYTNVDIGDESVLLVCSGTWDNQDGNNAAMDGIIFVYTDGVPTELGKVSSQGTAYPLTLSGDYLFAAGHQWICKYVISGGELQIMEMASVEWGKDGNPDTYYYQSEDGGDYTDMTQAETEEIYNKLYEEMAEGEVINFDVIQ